MDYADFGLGMFAGVLLVIGLIGLAFAMKGVRASVDAADAADDLRREVRDLRHEVDSMRMTLDKTANAVFTVKGIAE